MHTTNAKQRLIYIVAFSFLVACTFACGEDEPEPVPDLDTLCDRPDHSELEPCFVDEEVFGKDPDTEGFEVQGREDMIAICESRCTQTGSVRILDTGGLPDLKALSNLRKMRTITIQRTGDELISLEGLQVDDIGSISIEETQIRTFGSAFENLTRMRGLLTIDENNHLEDIDFPVLERFERFEGSNQPTQVVIRYNQGLKDISGFNALAKVDGVNIRFNGELLDISGFNALEGGDMELGVGITDNRKLSAISGFQSLNQVPVLALQDNDALKQCVVDDFVERTNPSDTDFIGTNGPPCDE